MSYKWKNRRRNLFAHLAVLLSLATTQKTTKRSRRATGLAAVGSSQLILSKVTIGVAALCSLAFFVGFLLVPVLWIVKSAFIGQGGVTLAYIRLLLSSEQFLASLKNSFRIAVGTTLFSTLVALPLALINSKFTYTGKQLLGALIIVSMFTPPFVGGIGINHFFSQYGTVNRLLMDLHIIDTPICFLNANGILPVVILQVLHLYPIMYLNLSTALSNIDPAVEEVATTLGISRFKRYKDIVWPLARPGFFAGATIIFIWSFTDLGIPLMTSFNTVLSVGIFQEMNEVGNNPYACAMVFFYDVHHLGVCRPIAAFASGGQQT